MTNDTRNDDEDRISAIGFVVKLWEERIFIIGIFAAFIFAAEGYIYASPDKYTTTMLLGHAASMEGGSASSGSSFGGAFAALGLGGGGASTDAKYSLFLTIVRTENFARLLQQKYHFENRHSNTILPTVQAVHGMLNSIIMTPDGDTLKASIQLSDREFSRQFLLIVYNEGNRAVRAMDTEKAKKFTAFIEDRFSRETSKSMQDALGALLVNQLRFLMLTSVDLPYATQLLDGPITSILPTAPNKSLIRALGFCVGLGMSIFFILVWDAVAGERRRRGKDTPGPSLWLLSTPRYAKGLLQRLHSRPRSR